MSRILLGVDIGGTNIKLATFDAKTHKLLQKEMIDTDAEKGFHDVLTRAVSLVEKYLSPEVESVGLCVAGPVQQPEGILLRAPNIPGSENIAVKKILEEHLKLPIAVGNDARCFTLAEAVLGAGKGHRVVCGITLGTGVGGGLVVDGKIYDGTHGFAGEIGHMLLRPGQPPFKTDDTRGSVEQFLSGTAFAQRCTEATSPSDYLQGETCSHLHNDIFREVAWLCANVTHAYDPSMIIFGGSTGKALKPHVQQIEKELSQWLLPSVPCPKLAFAEREHPGALGAALLSV